MFTRTPIRSFTIAVLMVVSVLPAAMAQHHSADTAPDQHINLSELLRVIQFFNSDGFHCEAGTEDGYAPGPGAQTCAPHDSDYSAQNWHINLSELLRVIQFFNSDGYHTECGSEDNFAPGPGSLFECGTEGEGGAEGEGEGVEEGEGGAEGEGEGVEEGEGGGEGEGEGVEEGEGGGEGEGEGVLEGEGGGEGEGEVQPPVADFWATATVGSVPFDAYFMDASTPGTSPIDSWAWDFGDGGTSTEQNPVHQYTTDGVYTVTLTVTANDLSDSVTQTDLVWAWYGIRNVDELQAMKNDLTAMYRLENDIDASATATWKGGFEPIGNDPNFTGIFDGQEYTISNLYINPGEWYPMGLFGTTENAEIRNVRLENVSVSGSSTVGSLVGRIWYGSAYNCSSSGEVSGALDVGGLIGEINNASVTRCSSSCDVTSSTSTAGGFAGKIIEGNTTSQCFATGTAHAESGNAGGFAGGTESWATVSECYATGAASTATSAGGFAGYCVQSTISDCFAMGLATGDQAGGLVGYTYDAAIANCFSTGHPDFPVTGGGLIGFSEYKGTVVTNSYWDTERSGIGSSPFGTGKTTAEMAQQATFIGWDFASVWAITENESYPWLQALWGVPPVADFSVDVDEGSVPLPVQFTDASDGKTDVNIDSWSWDFGDGSTSTDQNPSHTYTTSGMYTVILQITTPFGWDTKTKTALITTWTDIQNVDELQAMNDNLSGSYRLANDIDASDTATWKGGFVPIGGGANPEFTGIFDGQGFTITGLTLNWTGIDNIGLFGVVNGAEISNVNLINGHFTGNENVGSLVGSITQSSVLNCTSSGSVTGVSKVGGLLGEMSWTSVTGCSAECSVTSSAYTAGGLVSYVTQGCTINQCFATGSVSSQISNAGGLVGAMDSGAVISQCFASGPVSTETGVGGLAGTFSQSTMTDCFAMGIVSGNWAGGLIGLSTDADIANCFSTGRVYVTWDGGGLIGVDDYTYQSRVNHCYWDVDRSGMWWSPKGEGKTTAEMLIQPTFVDWDFANAWTNIAGETYPWLQALPTVPPKAGFVVDVTNGPTPLMVQFTDISSTGTDGYCDSWYWDFGDGSNSADQNPVHSYTTGGTFTVVMSITTLYGSDTMTKTALISTWHEISTVEQLQDMNLDPAGEYFLSSDIDASATAAWKGGFVPVGGGAYPVFSGSFDGQGHTITGLTIDWAGLDSVGLFGVVDGAEISSVNLADVHITGGNNVGSLVGSIANASISNCTSTGSVTGASQVGGLCGAISDTEITSCSADCPVTGSADNAGGLVGKETGESTIDLCYATGAVEAQISNAGGLVGLMDAGADISRSFAAGAVDSPDGAGGLAGASNQSAVVNCFAVGTVSGDNVGGLIGLSSEATITHCYSTGLVGFLACGGGLIGADDLAYPSTVTDCFWDMNSSNAGASSGGIGKSTAEMIQASTFTNWDFTDIWAIDEGLSYPWLQTLPQIGPVASFSISVENGEAPLEVAFTNNSFVGTYVNSAVWAWDFGDGATSTEQHPSNHTYTDTGTYTITLTVTTPVGTSADTHQIIVYLGIQTMADLDAVRDYPGEVYWLLNDIDASGAKSSEGWAPIPDFTGEFDGRGYTISNLMVNRPSETYGGLFGQTGSGANIHDLIMSGGSISAKCAGAIAGSISDSAISQCGSENVTVQGSDRAGGIAGEVLGVYDGFYPTVFRCYATGPVTSSYSSAGGLIGYIMYCNIEQCFATGPVTASFEAGGLVACSYDSCTFNSCFALGDVTCSYMYGGGFIGAINRYLTFTDCFCTGSVSGGGSPLGGFISFGVATASTFNHCFWSQENSGLTWSWDATDLATTAAMTQQASYAGWDFNSTGVWDIDEGLSYPWLRWFGPVTP